MLVYYSIGNSKGGSVAQLISGLPTYISMCILPLTIISIPQIIVELKNSIILRKMKTSGITKLNFFIVIIILFSLISIVCVFITFIIFLMFLNTSISKINYINFGQLIYVVLSLIFSSVTLAFFMGAIFKNLLTIQIISFAVFLITISLAGQFIPIQVIGDTMAVKIISLLSPLNYATALLNNVLIPSSPSGGDIFNLSSNFTIFTFSSEPKEMVIYTEWQKTLNIIMPYVSIISFSLIGLKLFNWYGR